MRGDDDVHVVSASFTVEATVCETVQRGGVRWVRRVPLLCLLLQQCPFTEIEASGGDYFYCNQNSCSHSKASTIF